MAYGPRESRIRVKARPGRIMAPTLARPAAGPSGRTNGRLPLLGLQVARPAATESIFRFGDLDVVAIAMEPQDYSTTAFPLPPVGFGIAPSGFLARTSDNFAPRGAFDTTARRVRSPRRNTPLNRRAQRGERRRAPARWSDTAARDRSARPPDLDADPARDRARRERSHFGHDKRHDGGTEGSSSPSRGRCTAVSSTRRVPLTGSFEILLRRYEDRLPLALLFAAVAEERTGSSREPPVDLKARCPGAWTFDARACGRVLRGHCGWLQSSGQPFGSRLGMLVARVLAWSRCRFGALERALGGRATTHAQAHPHGLRAHTARSRSIVSSASPRKAVRVQSLPAVERGALWDSLEMGLLL